MKGAVLEVDLNMIDGDARQIPFTLLESIMDMPNWPGSIRPN